MIIGLCQSNYVVEGRVPVSGILIGLLGVYLLMRRQWSVPKVIGAAAALGIVFCK